MIKLSDYQTKNSLPAEMKTASWISCSYAFDRQKKKYTDWIKQVHIWADLERVDNSKLDFLAVENRVLFYNAEFLPEIKRDMIRNSVYWYMKLGTRQAMEEILSSIFGEGKVQEWFEYGDDPFYFKISTNAILSPEMNEFFLTMLQRIKNTRSRLRTVEIKRKATQRTFLGFAQRSQVKPAAILDGYEYTEKTVQDICAGIGAGTQQQKNIAITEV